MAGQDFKQAHIIVSGRVQGVLFRSNAKKQADNFGLTGWVKNLPDGRVEILAQGGKDNLDKLISWSYQGPFFAKVEKVEVRWENPKEFFDTFEIVY